MKELKINLSSEKGSCGAGLFILEYDGKFSDCLMWHELLREVALITLPHGRHQDFKDVGKGKYLNSEKET